MHLKRSVPAKASHDRTPRFYIATHSDLMTEPIISRNSKDNNVANGFGNTPTLVAMRNGHDRVIRLLDVDPMLLLYKNISN